MDDRRMALLRETIGTLCPTAPADEIEARSLLAFCLAIGRHYLAPDSGDHTRARTLHRALDLLLEQPGAQPDAVEHAH